MPWSDSLRSFISLKDGAVSAPFRRVTAKHRSLSKMYLLTTNQMWLLKTNLLLTWARASAAWNCNMQSLEDNLKGEAFQQCLKGLKIDEEMTKEVSASSELSKH